jgi:DNA-binding NtrC family response regulator
MKVLVVDDEQLVRWFLERALNKWGHDVVSVSNIGEALAQMRQKHFDVLFTDLRMPEGNGSELVERVREIPDKDVKIVVCSAFITADMSEQFSKQGILTLKKPFKLADLEQTLSRCDGGVA